MPPKKNHVIEEYSVSKNTILCICGWYGDADEAWKQHKIDSKDVVVERELVPTHFQTMISKKAR